MDVLAELKRFIQPFDGTVIERALAGQPTIFDVDTRWCSSSSGNPRTIDRIEAFDGAAMLAGIQTVCFLGTHLPVGAPERRAVPMLHRKLLDRLANPELLLFAGWPALELEGEPYVVPEQAYPDRTAVHNGALVAAHHYTYFWPAKLVRDEDHDRCRSISKAAYPNQTFPWNGMYHAWTTVTSPGVAAIVERAVETPLPMGGSELDPRESAPALVEIVCKRRKLDPDAATLYLQLLALVDCGDAWLRQVNDWTATQHKKAAAKLVAAGLVREQKEPRATRKHVLPGIWEKLFPPHPAIEHWKLEL